MKLVFDIETDDLNASKIWCIVAIDEDNKVYSYKPGQIEEGIKLLGKEFSKDEKLPLDYWLLLNVY